MLVNRPWLPPVSQDLIGRIVTETKALAPAQVAGKIAALAAENRAIHEGRGINLNPATNIMNPKAEAFLGAGIGNRPSLGYPGDKYEMGLEAIEEIETIAAALAAEVFGAKYVELRVPSGALCNLYVFIACAKAGDTIIVPPPEIGGHVTHHAAGAAGLYGVKILYAPIDAENYTVDVAGLAKLAKESKPKLITLGGSLNLQPHPVAQVRQIAEQVGAKLLFDAAHLSGPIAGGAWPNPLAEGAHVMGMSTYKSLGGPPSGLLVTNDAELAQRLEAIAFPGLTANFDSAKAAALAVTLADWKALGRDYAAMMLSTAAALAEALAKKGFDLQRAGGLFTRSHQFAIKAAPLGGGQTAAKKLAQSGILSCGIGLPIQAVEGDLNGLRLGTPEIARRGMTPADMPALATLIQRALLGNEEPAKVAAAVAEFSAGFQKLHFVL